MTEEQPTITWSEPPSPPKQWCIHSTYDGWTYSIYKRDGFVELHVPDGSTVRFYEKAFPDDPLFYYQDKDYFWNCQSFDRSVMFAKQFVEGRSLWNDQFDLSVLE